MEHFVSPEEEAQLLNVIDWSPTQGDVTGKHMSFFTVKMFLISCFSCEMIHFLRVLLSFKYCTRM